jgi:hypothetical protein
MGWSMDRFIKIAGAAVLLVAGGAGAVAQEPVSPALAAQVHADQVLEGAAQIEIATALAGLIRERYVLVAEGETLAAGLDAAIEAQAFAGSRAATELTDDINRVLQAVYPDRHLGLLAPDRYAMMVAMFGEPEDVAAPGHAAPGHATPDHATPGHASGQASGAAPSGHAPTGHASGGHGPSADTGGHSIRAREAAGQAALHDIAGITRVSEISRDGLNQLGYVAFDRLISSPRSRAVISSILSTFTESDRIVIDLRECRGGDADMVQFLSSFFYAEPTHLVSSMMRDGTTRERWTVPHALSAQLADIPLEILISERSFSAAESMAFGLSRTGRARLLGQATGGGGHMNDFFALPHGFGASISVGRTYDPRTGEGWQTLGVVPDVAFEPGHALSGTSALITEESGRYEALGAEAREIYAALQAYTAAWYGANAAQMDGLIAAEFAAEYHAPSGLTRRDRAAQLAATEAGMGVLQPLFHNRIIRDIAVDGDRATARLVLRETTHEISLVRAETGWQVGADIYQNKRHG